MGKPINHPPIPIAIDNEEVEKFGRCAGLNPDGTRCNNLLKYRWYQEIPGKGRLCIECWEHWLPDIKL